MVDPIFPPEIIEMIVEFNPSAWWCVDRWHARDSVARITRVVEKYESILGSSQISLRTPEMIELLRLYVNMCRWDVFDREMVLRVFKLLLLRYNSYDSLILFAAIGYHHAGHIVDLFTRLSGELLNSYRYVHQMLEYEVCNKTYNYRNDVIIEIAATRPNAVEFIRNFIAKFYTPWITGGYDTKLYRFRDCINIDMGENIAQLMRQKICDVSDFGIKTNSKIGSHIVMGVCKVDMDTTKSLKKCVELLRLRHDGYSNMKLMLYVYKYFVNNIIKYNPQL